MTNFLVPLLLAAVASTAFANDRELKVTGLPDGMGPYKVGLIMTGVPITYGRVGATADAPFFPLDIWFPTDSPGTGADTVLNIPVPESTIPPYGTIPSFNVPYPLPGVLLGPTVTLKAGTYPLVVFAHGYGGSTTTNIDMKKRLASHGFIVASPMFLGSNALDNFKGTIDDMQIAAQNLPLDISAAISFMLSPYSGYATSLDAQKVAIVGHSLGAFGALASASADSRVKAIVPMAPALFALEAALFPLPMTPSTLPLLTPAQLNSITVPTLLFAAEYDNITPVQIHQDPIWAAIQCKNDDNMRVDILKAGHNSFSTLCEFVKVFQTALAMATDPFQQAVLGYIVTSLAPLAETGCSPLLIDNKKAQDITNMYTISFLKTVLVGDGSYYSQFLGEDYAETNPLLAKNVQFTKSDFGNRRQCINDQAYAGKDKGCLAEFPICLSSKWREIGAHVNGGRCGKCRNTYGYPEKWWPDEGCTKDKPHCVKCDGSDMKLNAGGDECVAL